MQLVLAPVYGRSNVARFSRDHGLAWGQRVLYFGAMLIGNAVWETLHLPLYTLWEMGSAPFLAFVVSVAR